jgi:hypothetical protein
MFSGGSGAAGRVSCLRVAEVCLPAVGKELKRKVQYRRQTQTGQSHCAEPASTGTSIASPQWNAGHSRRSGDSPRCIEASRFRFVVARASLPYAECPVRPAHRARPGFPFAYFRSAVAVPRSASHTTPPTRRSRQFASRLAHLLSLSVRKARPLMTRRHAFQYSCPRVSSSFESAGSLQIIRSVSDRPLLQSKLVA